MAPVFHVIEHSIPGQHIRESPKGTKHRQEDTLQICVKQYVPASTKEAEAGTGLTIIGVPGNGFPKETYEPFFQELYTYLGDHGVPLRAIWMADCSNQGASSEANEHMQGDDTSWFDHSRDLLLMVNHFRKAMPRPIIGVGHSMGCAQLVHLCMMHPRLLSTLVLIEPVMMDEISGTPSPVLQSTMRRDIWETRAKAESYLRKAFQSWDPRALDRLVEYGLRETPTALYNSDRNQTLASGSVTLKTTKHQEAWGYKQLNLDPRGEPGLCRLLRPDWDPTFALPPISNRPEPLIAMKVLPYLRPSVLYIFGAKGPLSTLEEQEKKVTRTGTGAGGSGGAAEGVVKGHVIQGFGHLVIFERPAQTARVAADWVRKWWDKWLVDERFFQARESEKSDNGMLEVSKVWIDAVTAMSNTHRRKESKI